MDNNPCGLNKQDTLEDAIKRADKLAPPDGSSHTGMMCDNKDLRRIVLLVKEYRTLQAENKKLKEQQLTEDEIRIIVFKSAITLNKEEAHRIAKATIKAREDKEVDPEDYVNRNWN